MKVVAVVEVVVAFVEISLFMVVMAVVVAGETHTDPHDHDKVEVRLSGLLLKPSDNSQVYLVNLVVLFPVVM